jgi:hypothetical protein
MLYEIDISTADFLEAESRRGSEQLSKVVDENEFSWRFVAPLTASCSCQETFMSSLIMSTPHSHPGLLSDGHSQRLCKGAPGWAVSDHGHPEEAAPIAPGLWP